MLDRHRAIEGAASRCEIGATQKRQDLFAHTQASAADRREPPVHAEEKDVLRHHAELCRAIPDRLRAGVEPVPAGNQRRKLLGPGRDDRECVAPRLVTRDLAE